MREMAFFLTHDFKPMFRKTLSMVDLKPRQGRRIEVLLDDRFEPPDDLGLRSIEVVKCRRHPSSFDPLGQAHNFYLERLRENRSILEENDYFWFVENDVYFHGSMSDFFDAHSSFDTDLIVPEFGHRHRGWCWISSAKGMSVDPIGVTAVAYRASRRLVESVLEKIDDGVQAHMEVMLPNLCRNEGMTVNQFIPDLVSVCNTFSSPFIALVENDLLSGQSNYIQNKLYHPVKI